MISQKSNYVIILAVVLLVAQPLYHPLLFFPLLHLRTLFLGLLPLLSFFPIAWKGVVWLSGEAKLRSIERLVYALFGAGFLASQTAFLFLTLHIGFSYVFIFFSLFLILLSWGWWKKWIAAGDWRLSGFSFVRYSRWETGLLAVALFLGLAAAVLPPVGYDAHEYHLSAPQSYLEAGRWVAFPYNVYGAFPMNVEMLYLWPLAGGSSAGCTAINLFYAGITALAIWRLSRIGGASSRSLLAPLIFFSTGMTQQLILQANIDIALAASAAVLLLAYERYRFERRPIDAAMMAIALGFALGSKLIAVLAIGVPFAAVVLFDLNQALRRRMAVPLLWVALGALLLFAPWAVRNAVLYGNPFYPLLTSTLGGTPEFFGEVFRKAHAPHWDSIGNLAWSFVFLPLQKCIGDAIPSGYSCLWILGIPGLALAGRRHPAFRLLAFMSTAYVFWFFLTQHEDRFLAACLPAMALFGAYAVEWMTDLPRRRWMRRLVLAITALQLYGAASMIIRPETAEYLLLPTVEPNYLSQRMPHYRAIEWLNREWERPRNSIGTVLFVGEAQSYGAQFPAIVPAVFNHHPLETGLDRNVTHILFNGSELKRLRDGYGPLGWPLGDFLFQWMEQNKTLLNPVYDAYPEKPGVVVVYEIVR